jgi:hypothetical protein
LSRYTIRSYYIRRNQYLIDDRSIEGEFPLRRIWLSCDEDKEIELLPLKKAVLSLGSLIIFAKLYHNFIDNAGTLFTYIRSTPVPVITREIVKALPYKNSSVLVIKNTHCPLIFYRPVKADEKYAILACVEKGYILLGVSRTEYLRRAKIKI